MKMKFYSVLISALLFISFSTFADTDVKSVKATGANIKKSQMVTGKRSVEFFGAKSSVYNKVGLVKRKGSKKSCPAFEL